MATTRSVSTKQIEAHGMIVAVFTPGAFYQGVFPGGFGDSLTGIHVPGPIARLDGTVSRQIVRLEDLPDPVQIPFYKRVVEISDSGKQRKEIDVLFNANDEQPVHEALQLALTCGQIRLVPDHIVEEKYPNAWAARKEPQDNVWFTPEAAPKVSMEELLRDAESDGRLLYISQATKKAEDERRAAIEEEPAPVEASAAPRRKVPPPPPPKTAAPA